MHRGRGGGTPRRGAGRDLPELFIEDKRLSVVLHYRQAADAHTALAFIEDAVAGPARRDGLEVMTGKMAIEIRPPVPVTKGTAIGGLLRDGGYAAALFAGDDLTDVTALKALRIWAGGGDRVGLGVAVAGDETPRRCASRPTSGWPASAAWATCSRGWSTGDRAAGRGERRWPRSLLLPRERAAGGSRGRRPCLPSGRRWRSRARTGRARSRGRWRGRRRTPCVRRSCSAADQRALGGDLDGQLHRLDHELGARADRLHETDAQRFVGAQGRPLRTR